MSDASASGEKAAAVVLASAPRLWQAVRSRHGTPAEQHAALRRAVASVLAAHGFIVKEGHRASYFEGRREVSGRIDLVCTDAYGAPLVALEIDFQPNIRSCWKLLQMHRQGFVCVLLAGFASDYPAARNRVDTWFKTTTRSWLKIGTLTSRSVKPG